TTRGRSCPACATARRSWSRARTSCPTGRRSPSRRAPSRRAPPKRRRRARSRRVEASPRPGRARRRPRAARRGARRRQERPLRLRARGPRRRRAARSRLRSRALEAMDPARVSSHHARAVLLVTVLLALAGFVTLLGLPSDIYPPLNFPRVVIIGHTGTLPARSMALSVTRPIEQVVMEVPGIRRVRSQTFRGSTEISAQFDPNADILQALQQVQNRVAELRGELPAETELTVERLTTSTF